uniref:uncharacterized protein LOC106992853 n=1 Tax=Macaca mulatta TaxID=9544 RepID=UPI000732785D|nr:uncharacterized protein LOC106992853 [Macaca mulatta]
MGPNSAPWRCGCKVLSSLASKALQAINALGREEFVIGFDLSQKMPSVPLLLKILEIQAQGVGIGGKRWHQLKGSNGFPFKWRGGCRRDTMKRILETPGSNTDASTFLQNKAPRSGPHLSLGAECSERAWLSGEKRQEYERATESALREQIVGGRLRSRCCCGARSRDPACCARGPGPRKDISLCLPPRPGEGAARPVLAPPAPSCNGSGAGSRPRTGSGGAD